ncbi:DUF3352 domain-containing protein [Allorhodopirellula solitaria]|uniref:Uncharacterized protein n=1 Tax=Allorhodopirellula solitaria TaxID=2527987 RepID=A0A5C5XWW9_9BACT|nr:DUF3352 domain-containing protein [Allorhodopirellula solitaria]TWT66395.1 hypothetical protein CA85_24890 [Allorhodopirellula solitaria]
MTSITVRLARYCSFALVVGVVSLGQQVAVAQDRGTAGDAVTFESDCPPASRLLPSDTMAYLRIRNTTEMKAGFSRSTLGQMLEDPAMRPFVSDSYQTISQLMEEFASQIGLSLDEMLSIPQGQVALAIVPGASPEAAEAKPNEEETDEQIARRMQQQRRSQNSFGGVFIVETGRQNDSADSMERLLTQIGELATRNQFVESEEKLGGHSVTTWQPPRQRGPTVEWFYRDGVYVIGIGRETATDVLRRWQETDPPENRKEAAQQSKSATSDLTTSENLSSNADFGAVMTRSVGAEAETPQVTFFANPYAIAKKIISRSTSSFFIMPIVEELGIEKIRGIGGSVFRGGDIVEGIMHLHVVIDPPRDGFFGVIRPEPVEPTPPNWAPADSTSYLTSNWDVVTAADNLAKIVNRFAGEGKFEEFTEDRIQARLNVSLKDDLLANLTGRYVGIRRYQAPAAWNSVARVDALQVRDVDKAKAMLDKIRDRLPAADMKPESIGGVQVYFLRPGRELPDTLRRVERSLMLLDDYLVLSDSREIAEQILRARGGAQPRLADDADYALMLSELGAKLAGEQPFFLSFNRDADSYRVLYEMAASPKLADAFGQRGENNPVAGKFGDLLRRQKLPKFDDLRKYFNVSGSFAYDESGGLHFGMMTLRPLE